MLETKVHVHVRDCIYEVLDLYALLHQQQNEQLVANVQRFAAAASSLRSMAIFLLNFSKVVNVICRTKTYACLVSPRVEQGYS